MRALVLAEIALLALVGATLGWRAASRNEAATAAPHSSHPKYRLTVIGRLPGTAASLPQSIDGRGVVVGLSGQVAGVPLPAGEPFDTYAASLFLYSGGRLLRLNPPRAGEPLLPVNVVLAGPHTIAATFADPAGNFVEYYGEVDGSRVSWRPLRLAFKDADTNIEGVYQALPDGALVGLLVGEYALGGWCEVTR